MSDLDVTTSFARTLVDEWVAQRDHGRGRVARVAEHAAHAGARARRAAARRRRARRTLGRVPRARHRPRDGPARDRVLHVGHRGREPRIPPWSRRTTPGCRCSCAPPIGPPSCATGARARRSTRPQLFGGAVRWFHDPGPPEADDRGRGTERPLARAGVQWIFDSLGKVAGRYVFAVIPVIAGSDGGVESRLIVTAPRPCHRRSWRCRSPSLCPRRGSPGRSRPGRRPGIPRPRRSSDAHRARYQPLAPSGTAGVTTGVTTGGVASSAIAWPGRRARSRRRSRSGTAGARACSRARSRGSS